MRTTTIPSYLFGQYADDDDLQAFKDAYNGLTQGFIDALVGLNLPVYTGLTGGLLDWVGTGLYNIPRPYVPLPNQQVVGTFDTYALDTLEFAAQRVVGTVQFLLLDDDYYKRVLTWHKYLGDGRQFCVPWLKRRISRFLWGLNGADITGPSDPAVSIVTSGGTFTITLSPLADTAYAATIFQAVVNAGVLELPFQYTYSVQVMNNVTLLGSDGAQLTGADGSVLTAPL